MDPLVARSRMPPTSSVFEFVRVFAARAGRVAAHDTSERWRRTIRGAIFWLATAVCGWAHDPGISSADVTLSEGRIEVTTGFAPLDAEQLVPAELRTAQRMTEVEFQRIRGQLEAIAPRLWEVRADDRVLAPEGTGVELLPGDNVSFRASFPRPGAAERVTLRATQLGELPAGHRQFVIVSDERGSALTKKLLRAGDDTIAVSGRGDANGADAASEASAEATNAPTFFGFVWLGIEHIWIGYDHLLFLFALLVVCRSFRSIVAIITCFTLAHSLTLALATFEVVTLPSRFVEAAIAATIVFVGVENLVRRDREPPGRWALTFAFGLIHGFGFAGVLRELGVGGGRVALPLLSFNLGVELGQIAIAAAVLPAVWWLRKKEKFVRVGVPALSIAVALAGAYWLLERTVLG